MCANLQAFHVSAYPKVCLTCFLFVALLEVLNTMNVVRTDFEVQYSCNIAIIMHLSALVSQVMLLCWLNTCILLSFIVFFGFTL